MKLLRVADITPESLGGMSGYMSNTTRELERLGYQISSLFAGDLRVAALPASLQRFAIPWLVVRRVTQAHRRGESPDVVEIHEPHAGPYCVLRKRLPRLNLPPCVVLSYGLEERAWSAQRDRVARRHGRLSIKSRVSVPLTRLLPIRLALANSDHIAVPSTEDRDYLLARLGIDAGRITLAPTGVDPALLQLVQKSHGSSVKILFLGTWIDRKGTPELVDAWVALAGSRPWLTLTLAGTGVAAAEVLSAFPGEVRTRVTVLASVSRPAVEELLCTHDVFVLPSWFEGMPLSMLEAAAAGLPCVVTAVCGNVDFIRRDQPEDDGGVLVGAHDSLALARALERLVDDRALRARLGGAARQRARSFTWASSAAALAVAYETAAARP